MIRRKGACSARHFCHPSESDEKVKLRACRIREGNRLPRRDFQFVILRNGVALSGGLDGRVGTGGPRPRMKQEQPESELYFVKEKLVQQGLHGYRN